MANIEHSAITGPDLHEPKGVSAAADNTLARAVSSAISWGKIDDPDYIADDTLDIDNIDETSIKELNTLYLTVDFPDIATAGSVWVVCPVAGNVVDCWSVIHGAITVSDETITLERSGVAMTGGTITITQSGSAAGDVDTTAAGITGNNDITASTAIEIISAGACTGPQRATFTVKVDIT